MNKTLLTILMLALLLLFIISPFAALASLMMIVFVSAFFSILGNLFQVIIGGDTDPKAF